MYIDLTHILADDTPVYPGDAEVEITQTASLVKDGYVDHAVGMGVHAGTHLDSPQHFIEGGKNIAGLDIETFFGRGVLVDARGKAIIDADTLTGVDIKPQDIVLVWTGWSAKFKRADYFTGHPSWTEDLARRLLDSGIKMVGVDGPSPDYEPFAIHKIFLGQGIPIMENLTNLDRLAGTKFELIALPAKFEADGAPVRVVARVI
jgi:kynurenine formamidase